MKGLDMPISYKYGGYPPYAMYTGGEGEMPPTIQILGLVPLIMQRKKRSIKMIPRIRGFLYPGF